MSLYSLSLNLLCVRSIWKSDGDPRKKARLRKKLKSVHESERAAALYLLLVSEERAFGAHLRLRTLYIVEAKIYELQREKQLR